MHKHMQQKESKIKWLDVPEEHDYPAAESYLKLHFDDKTVMSLLETLKRNPITGFKAKDIFRASGLSLLGVSNSHVEKDLRKIRDGNKLSPLLLVRDRDHAKVIIADGYHRLCAVYSVDEDAMIPCKIA
jgi:disulfide oxidoreductase YuzD